VSTTDASATTVLRLRPDRTDPLEALLVGAGPHLVEVLDVGTAPNGDLLLVLPVPAVRLAALLTAPGGVTAGEAVTVLVPLAQALHRLHASGVAHGGIAADAVELDADGCPAWSAPESPSLRRRVGPAAFAERAAEDVAAFRGLCATLLGPLAGRIPDEADPEALAVALFAIAVPEPVRLPRPAATAAQAATPSRLLPAVAAPRTEVAVSAARGLSVALAGALRTVRVRAWIALGAVAAMLVGAIVLLPGGDDGAPAAAPVRSAVRSARATVAPVAERGLDGARAVRALLQERERCLASGSESCLRRVDAAGSPALQADLDAVRAGTDAARVDRARLRVPPGSGGTALATSGDATVLAVREQNGWRLRDVVAEPPAEG
jgi:hypothetical protein